MRRNSRKIYVWVKEASDWGNPINTNLLSIFETLAPDLLDEASNETLADSLGLRYGNVEYRRYGWPVPKNFVKAYLADLVSLDLISNSAKRHSVSDTKAYWMLTDFGRQVHGNIRRNELLKGLADFEEAPEDEVSES